MLPTLNTPADSDKHFEQFEIHGFRGFQTPGKIDFAIPNGTSGSGLTIIVGSNNSGKSTVIEGLQTFIGNTAPSFTQGRRNTTAGDRVDIHLTWNKQKTSVRSIGEGTSEAQRIDTLNELQGKIFVLESRRSFAPFFGKGTWDRSTYIQNAGTLSDLRRNALDAFSMRLFDAMGKRAAFNEVLSKVVSPLPQWSIDQLDTGQYYIKVKRGTGTHSSEGLGQGLVSLLFIIDALYDSSPGQLIAIDEPELSLHPALQKKLAVLLADYAADRQIVIATHSPYFAGLQHLGAGSTIVRATSNDDDGTTLHQLTQATGRKLAKLLTDRNNPHVLGLKAQEVFFLDDHPILFEGQEDIVLWPTVERELSLKLAGEPFGWGVGGASKMELIAHTLKELGFKKVAGILDGDKTADVTNLTASFPGYKFLALPAKDIRVKPAREAVRASDGLLDESNAIQAVYSVATSALIESVNEYLA